MVALQHLPDPTIEALDQAVGLGVSRRGQGVLDGQFVAELIELVVAGDGAFAQTEETAGDLFAIVGTYGSDAQRAARFRLRRKRRAFAAVFDL